MSEGDLTAEVVGIVEKDSKVLVIRRIDVIYSLALDAEHHEAAERVHEFHADYCPVARSIGGSIDISTKLEFR